MGKWLHLITDVDEEARTGHCANCGPVRVKRKGTRWACWELESRWHRGHEAWRLPPQERADLLDSQGGACAICGKSVKLVLDHDHLTGAPRGLLCPRCNMRLAAMEDEVWRGSRTLPVQSSIQQKALAAKRGPSTCQPSKEELTNSIFLVSGCQPRQTQGCQPLAFQRRKAASTWSRGSLVLAIPVPFHVELRNWKMP